MSLIVEGDVLQVANVLRQLSVIFNTPVYDSNLNLFWVQGNPYPQNQCPYCHTPTETHSVDGNYSFTSDTDPYTSSAA
uniref:Uncharacterized protein n=1 Tax=Bird deltacoronavirus AnasCN24 TaxID=3237947 RepID=A0AB39AG80_9NIDO